MDAVTEQLAEIRGETPPTERFVMRKAAAAKRLHAQEHPQAQQLEQPGQEPGQKRARQPEQLPQQDDPDRERPSEQGENA
jgi:hypothetical protein